MAIVHKFNDDPSIDLLLLTTHVGGLGLNLTGADTVIFMEHDWNPQKGRFLYSSRSVSPFSSSLVGTFVECPC
jgi:hypothetical protein